MFLRKTASSREPLPLAMIGLRMGERVVQIGLDDARLMTTLAAKPGISGRSALVVRSDRDAVRAQSAAAEAGTLIEVHVTHDVFPFDDGAFDVAIVHGADRSLVALEPAPRAALLSQAYRVLRQGGRLVAIEPGTPGGWTALLHKKDAGAAREPGLTAGALTLAGFSAVRLLADREGYRFTEGLKR